VASLNSDSTPGRKTVTTLTLLLFNFLCVLALWLLLPVAGTATLIFVLAPAAAAGRLYGPRPGLLSGLLNLALAALLARVRGLLNTFTLPEGLLFAACSAALPLLTGRVRRLRAELKAGVPAPGGGGAGERANRYGELVQKVNSIVLCMDLQGKITFFNEFAETYFGYTRAEVIGRSLFGTIVPEGEKMVEQLLEHVRTTNRIPGTFGYNENENITSTGKRVWIAWTNKVIPDSRGRAVEILSVGLDISGRKHMEDQLRTLNTTLHTLNADMVRDIQSAARIQKSILPTASPRVSAIRFDWLFEPSATLGGDIFNVFLLDEHNVGFYVLDVSGHGVTAALLSVTLNRLLSDMSALLKKKLNTAPGYSLNSPALVAERLNEQFQLDEVMQQYFTLGYGIFNINSLKLCYVSAGHPGMVHIPAGGEARLLQSASYPIGFHPHPGYQEQTLQLASGDRLYLCTDGLLEALDPRDRCFGTERLLACLNRDHFLPLPETLTLLRRELERWGNGKKAEDDITLLAAEIGAPEPM
jgi:PAS domain S-box-containing protein